MPSKTDSHAANYSQTVALSNRRGLHARASAALARLVGGLPAEVHISNGRESVPATSIMGLMMLGAACGDEITITANGEDAAGAVSAVVALVADRFGESE